MWYTSYDFEKCIERDCNFCKERLECIHYTPYEGYSEGEEYRTFISPLDDTSGELIRNVARKISRLGYPEREIYTLTLAWYLLGYQVKDLLVLVSKGVHPLEVEKFINVALAEEIRLELQLEIEERISSSLEEEIDIDEETGEVLPPLSLETKLEELEEIEFLLETIKVGEEDLLDHPIVAEEILPRLKNRNFTGEVRLGPPEEEPQEKPISPEVQRKVDEALKWASSVRNARTGRYAYLFSQKCREMISQLPPDWAEVVKDQLRKAWEEWKSSHAKKK